MHQRMHFIVKSSLGVPARPLCSKNFEPRGRRRRHELSSAGQYASGLGLSATVSFPPLFFFHKLGGAGGCVPHKKAARRTTERAVRAMPTGSLDPSRRSYADLRCTAPTSNDGVLRATGGSRRARIAESTPQGSTPAPQNRVAIRCRPRRTVVGERSSRTHPDPPKVPQSSRHPEWTRGLRLMTAHVGQIW